jgi:two-component system NarL family sensor kinase
MKTKSGQNRWLIVALIFLAIAILEYTTPPTYVIGYLYVGAILLADIHTSTNEVRFIAGLAILLTLLNLVIPGTHPITLPDIINRSIVAIALAITIWLLEVNRLYQKTVVKQQYQLQSQIKMADLKEDFAATLTHDLRTPLLGAIETIKAFQTENFGQITAAQRRVLEIMMTSHQNTIELVQTLSDVYKHDLEGLVLETEIIDLVTVAEQAILELNQLASNRRIIVRLGYSNSDFRQACWVNGDRVQL